jgi:ArsR family transcriptional regulator
MDMMKAIKALANETRVNVLRWLRNPEGNFPPQIIAMEEIDFVGGVCCCNIKQKCALSMSATSQYLSVLVDAGLVETKRVGQWTFFRRNEENIQKLAAWIGEEL